MPILQLLFWECIIVLIPVHTLLAGDTNSLEKRIRLWKESVVNLYAEKRLRISSRVDIKTPEFYEIVAIGIPCLKQLIIMQKSDSSLTVFLPLITKVHADNYFCNAEKVYIWIDYPSYCYTPQYLWKSKGIKNQENFWTYWWNEGRKFTPEIFKRKYEAYQTAKNSGKNNELEKTYIKLQNMGIIILPKLLEKIESGNKELIPMFKYLSDQKNLKTVEDCKTWWKENKIKYKDLLDY